MLHVPDTAMRNAQAALLKHILSKYQTPEYVYAFETDKNIPKMAELHTGKTVVVSLDIENFFGNVTQKTIFEVLTRTLPSVSPQVARTISELVTYKAYLPQGGVTSPKVSNIVVMETFGPEVFGYCMDNGLKLSIYADDITFSFDGDVRQAREHIKVVRAMLRKHRFRINNAKTKIMHKTMRQYVCGAVVNEKVNLPRKAYRDLKATVHNVVTHGVDSQATRAGAASPEQFIASLKGKINWLRQLNPARGQRLMDELNVYLTNLQVPQTT